jgi:hypothetical protein
MPVSTTYRHAIDSGDLACVPLRVVHLNADETTRETRETPEDDRGWGWVLGEEGKQYRVRVLREAFADPNQSLVDFKQKIPTLAWNHLGELAEWLEHHRAYGGPVDPENKVTAIRVLYEKKAWLDEVVGNGTTSVGSFARALGVPSSP